MKIPVLGIDPSLRNWGLAASYLDLNTGVMDTPVLTIIQPDDLKGKQVRNNSNDLHLSQQLADIVIPMAQEAKAIFVEVPVGSQNARAMASYGICVGIMGAMRSLGIPLIEVTPTEVKLALTGNKNASKKQMIDAAIKWYPSANFPLHGGKLTAKAEHVADAIATIHAGVHTDTFQNLLRLYRSTK